MVAQHSRGEGVYNRAGGAVRALFWRRRSGEAGGRSSEARTKLSVARDDAMGLFVIGDLHLSLGVNKPMDVFGGWQDYVPKLKENWKATVQPNDTVVLLGDTSWGMRLEECEQDFAFIEALPGKKWLIKGNHDYWWTTRRKIEDWLESSGFGSIGFLRNNYVYSNGVCVCGTRGWLYQPSDAFDTKIMARETQRLELSLQLAEKEHPEAERIAFLHYPPVWQTARAQPLIEVMQNYAVKRCFYGHLHGGMIKRAVQGVVDGIEYTLVSADALKFEPKKIL